MSKILYIGDSHQHATSRHRADALIRLGHQVEILDPYLLLNFFLRNKILGSLNWATGYRFIQRRMCNFLKTYKLNLTEIDLIWMNGGELFGPEALRLLKKLGAPIILYNNDDPTGYRDGNRFSTLIQSIYLYDHCAVMRDINVEEYKKAQASSVQRVWMSYDELVHMPYENAELIPAKFRSEVSFIGTWMRHEHRDDFLLELVKRGVPIAIWGDRWNKSPLWPQLKKYYRGPSLGGRDYVAAIQGSKISIGMLSKGNRDLHTRRSLEIPYAGGVLLAERTSEHQLLYQEGVDALFWSDAEECASKCHSLLANDSLREEVRLAGMKRVRENKLGNEDICQQILLSCIKKY